MKLPIKAPNMNRNFLMLAGAFALGLVAVGLSYKYLSDRTAQIQELAGARRNMVKIVVAKQDLPRGFVVQRSAFAIGEVPAQYLNSTSIDPKHFLQFVGQKLIVPVMHGEPLLKVDMESGATVFSSTLQSGNRALTTEVDEVNSISGLLRPSDHIDLMATAHGSGKKSTDETFPLLTNVEVLATGQVTRKGEGDKGSKTYTTITLSVSPQDAERIVVAKAAGKLTAVLRNPDDSQMNPTTAMNIDDVLPKKHGSGGYQASIQYIIGGH